MTRPNQLYFEEILSSEGSTTRVEKKYIVNQIAEGANPKELGEKLAQHVKEPHYGKGINLYHNMEGQEVGVPTGNPRVVKFRRGLNQEEISELTLEMIANLR